MSHQLVISALLSLSALFGVPAIAGDLHIHEALTAQPTKARPQPLIFSEEAKRLEDPTGGYTGKGAQTSSSDNDVRFGGQTAEVDAGCKGVSMDITPGAYCDADAPQCGDGVKLPGKWTKSCECKADSKACPSAEELARMGITPKQAHR